MGKEIFSYQIVTKNLGGSLFSGLAEINKLVYGSLERAS
jgi:hypothetical protein